MSLNRRRAIACIRYDTLLISWQACCFFRFIRFNYMINSYFEIRVVKQLFFMCNVCVTLRYYVCQIDTWMNNSILYHLFEFGRLWRFLCLLPWYGGKTEVVMRGRCHQSTSPSLLPKSSRPHQWASMPDPLFLYKRNQLYN